MLQTCHSDVTNLPHLRGMLSHFTSIFEGLINKKCIGYTAIMKQSDTFVLDKCKKNTLNPLWIYTN